MKITREFSDTTNKRLGRLFLVLALICVGLGGWAYIIEDSFIGAAQLAKGEVIEVRKNGTRPTIKYLDSSGNEVIFEPRSRSSADEFVVGEMVDILRRDSAPAEAKLNRWFHLWSTTFFAMLFCGIFGSFAVLTLSGKVRWGPLKQNRITVGGG